MTREDTLRKTEQQQKNVINPDASRGHGCEKWCHPSIAEWPGESYLVSVDLHFLFLWLLKAVMLAKLFAQHEV